MRKTIVACTITALAVGGGTASAAKLITSKDIADGAIHNRDIAEDAISLNRLSPSVRAAIAQAGTPGKDGVNGNDGVNGKDGAGGAAGLNGTDGAAGAAGELGLRGAQGIKGDQGVKGDQGTQGGQGLRGADGVNGKDGAAGKDGLNSDVPRQVTAANLNGWTLLPAGTNPDPTPNGTADFIADAGTPLGAGALRLQNDLTGKNLSAMFPVRAGSAKPKLSELTTAGFASKVLAQTAPNQDVALKITVTGANTGTASGFTTLVFEGAYNRDQNADELNKWHRWNVRGGKLWSTRPLVNAPNGSCGQTVGCTIEEIVANSPNAVVTSVRVEVGQNGGTAATDATDTRVDDVRLGFDGDFIRYDLGA
jgi:hypothetical protein